MNTTTEHDPMFYRGMMDCRKGIWPRSCNAKYRKGYSSEIDRDTRWDKKQKDCEKSTVNDNEIFYFVDMLIDIMGHKIGLEHRLSKQQIEMILRYRDEYLMRSFVANFYRHILHKIT